MKKNYRRITMLFFLTVLISVTTTGQNWEVDLLKNINPQNPQNGYMNFTSNSIYWVPATITAGTFIASLITKDRTVSKKTIEQLMTAGISIALTEVGKVSTRRLRPEFAYPLEIFPVSSSERSKYKSFPSGHTSAAFSSAAIVSMQFKKWYVVVPAFLWAGSVGYSRMYLGKHYPTDVLAGALLGTASAWLSIKISNKLFKPTTNEAKHFAL